MILGKILFSLFLVVFVIQAEPTLGKRDRSECVCDDGFPSCSRTPGGWEESEKASPSSIEVRSLYPCHRSERTDSITISTFSGRKATSMSDVIEINLSLSLSIHWSKNKEKKKKKQYEKANEVFFRINAMKVIRIDYSWEVIVGVSFIAERFTALVNRGKRLAAVEPAR